MDPKVRGGSSPLRRTEKALLSGLNKVLTRAEKTVEKEIDVDRDEFKKEPEKAEKEWASA